MSTMIIGICDDELCAIDNLKGYIEQYLQEKRLEAEIKTFTSGEELLKQINEFKVVFLDIEMPEEDGISVGQKVRQANPDCRIIMATGMMKRFKEAFMIQAFRFITKPLEMYEIEEAMDAVFAGDFSDKVITAYYKRAEYTLKQTEISYIQAYNGYVEIVVGDKIFRKDVALGVVEEELDERLFCKVQRKYIINFRHMQSYNDSKAVIDGCEIEISRRNRKNFEQKYMEYDLNYR